MSFPFTFKDSRPDQPVHGRLDLPSLFCAIEKLNEAARKGDVPLLALSGKRRVSTREFPEIMSYSVKDKSANYNWETILSANVNVSHYIGSYSTMIPGRHGNDLVIIEIKPRWGASILHYLLRYTTGIYMPPDALQGEQTAKDSAEWLLILMWRSVFHQALRTSHTPKEYRPKLTNDRFFKGRLDVQRQISQNLTDQSKFCCVHAPLTIDTVINQTIRCVFRLLSRRATYAALLNGMAAYDERLAAFGVTARDVRPVDIDRIRYTRMSAAYRPLMQVGKAILNRFGAANSTAVSKPGSFLIDVAELWENYLQAILLCCLPSHYRVVNPNETGGPCLISGQRREIRPDLIIEDNQGRPLAILDAKFKPYTAVGRSSRDGVSREDLYQMVTYLSHYGERDRPLLGLFISPKEEAEDLHPLENRRQHQIGVLGFDLTKWNDQPFDIHLIHADEERFVDRVLKILRKVHTATVTI